MTQDEAKRAVAAEALKYIEADRVVGVGTGSTANHFIDALAAANDVNVSCGGYSQQGDDMVYRIHLFAGPHAREELDVILDAFVRASLPVWHALLEQRDAEGVLAVVEGIEQFREHLGGRLCITLPDGIGQRVEVNDMNLALVEEGIAFLKDYR